ncbi:microtubule associated tumor suppressor candidate 2 [Pitangus sulphuratus]|nr:microtubule associated tumor suppressor candidate 2 [Pitangus sulphuratus]
MVMSTSHVTKLVLQEVWVLGLKDYSGISKPSYPGKFPPRYPTAFCMARSGGPKPSDSRCHRRKVLAFRIGGHGEKNGHASVSYKCSSFGNEDQATPKASAPSKDVPKGSSKSTTQASSSTATPRRSLLPAPKTATAPAGHPKQRPTTPKNGFSPKPGEGRDTEKQFIQRLKEKCDEQSRQLINIQDELKRASCGFDVFAITTQYFFRQDLDYMDHDSKIDINGKNKNNSFNMEKNGLHAYVVVEQYGELCYKQQSCIRENLQCTSSKEDTYLHGTPPVVYAKYSLHQNCYPQNTDDQNCVRFQNENALVKIKELGVELAKIRDEVALNTARWKKLLSEKEELERRFEEEGKQLRRQQQEEMQALEQRLQEEYSTKRESLQEQHRLQLEQAKLQHQDQVEDITAVHEAAMLQLENNHIVAITVLQDENDCKIQELNTAHKLEKAQLEETFEKLRLSLQDQIDTLTFQNQSLKAKADRFEEALKKNTEEQLKIVRAPYLHLEKDLKSLKHVLEMKNFQIHQQEKMIMELEKQVEKNLKLEEKITMLQQQNEELRARIEQNTVITRQLSEENANLQEYVEKEVEEKKKLSRTNEELLWKLQEGDAVDVLPVLGNPELDAALQVGSHQSRVERKNPLPRPAGHVSSDAAYDMIGFLGLKHSLLAHVQPLIHQYPQVFLLRAALNPFIPQPVLIPGAAPIQVQHLALGLIEPHDFLMDPLLKPVKVPLDGIPSLRCINCITQLGVTCKLVEDAPDPPDRVISEDVKQFWFQYGPVRATTCY